MNFKDLLSLYFERSNAANGLWGFYITVVLGLLAYFGAHSHQVLLAMLISIGFTGFAFVNMEAILDVARARHAAAELMKNYRAPDAGDQAAVDTMKKTVAPSSIGGIRSFHVASDVAVLTGLWILTLYKR